MTTLTYKTKGLKPVHDHILVSDMEFQERFTSGGIIIPSDDKKSEGIRPRWGRVFAIGNEQTDVKVGQWVLIEHGRWTRGIKVDVDGEEVILRRIDPEAILLVSDEQQFDDSLSSAVTTVSDRSAIEGSIHNDGTNYF